MQKLLILFLSLLMAIGSLSAQNEIDEDLMSAEAYYDMGRFYKVDSLLAKHVTSMKSSQNREKAYRLLALSAIYTDRMDDAHTYTQNLLQENPFFTDYDASPIFQDMLAKLKKVEVTVSTASGQDETEAEAPVPMTIITEDMIKISGAQTLQDLLCLFVPGMTRVEGIEKNVSMRGICGQMQENILVMQDGHRMNSGATNAESPDFRIALDRIKQIEILRGPASSLYGNVALSAVVNIITKRGIEVDGLQANISGGMHSQIGGNILFGKGNMQTDIFAWANLYYAKGEEVVLNNTISPYVIYEHSRYINGYNEKPAFDAGVRARWKDFTVSVTAQHAKQVPFYSLIAIGGDAAYDLYSTQNGNSPGTSRTSINVAADYNHKFGRINLGGSLYFNSERTQIYNILGDTIETNIAKAVLALVGSSMTSIGTKSVSTRGVYQSMEWQDYTIGGNMTATLSYGAKHKNRGNIMIGGQFEYFIMSSSSFLMGKEYEKVSQYLPSGAAITLGNEWVLSPFAQWKHHFGDHFVFNTGIRYDHKQRFQGDDLRAVSPRASFVWLPSKVVSVKLGYSRSFEDAPYLYRSSKIDFLSGGTDLKPQFLNSIQLGTLMQWESLHLKFEANVFYNIATDVVQYDTRKAVEGVIKKMYGEDVTDGLPFRNSSSIQMGGIELVLEYNRPKHTYANFNMTMQEVFKYSQEKSLEGIESLFSQSSWASQLPDNYRPNEPKLFFNITAGQCVYSSKKLGDFWVRGNMHFQSGMYYMANDYGRFLSSFLQFYQEIQTGKTENLTLLELPTRATWQNAQYDLNLGVNWNKHWVKNRMLSVALDVYNVTDNDKLIGTQCQGPMPNQGIRVVGKVSYHF